MSDVYDLDEHRLLTGLKEEERCRERDAMEDDLYLFLKGAWPNLNPTPFIDGWPLEALADHLMALAHGEIRNLLVNIPPRCSKSTLCSVAFPSWIWAQGTRASLLGPQVRFLHASYGYNLSERDSLACQKLIGSPWYQKYWGDRFKLTRTSAERLGNDQHGERLITSIQGRATGEGGDFIIVDDPNAANEVESEASTLETNEWWDGTMSTRLNVMATGARLIIQQRLGEDDLTGHILSKDHGDYVHLVMPMRFEAWRSTHVTPLGWSDPRTEEGELLWPERFRDGDVRFLESEMGPFKAAGQLQQRPEPQGGGVIKRDWWKLWDQTNEAGAVVYPPFDFILASLDTAYTIKEINDPSALTVWGVFRDDQIAQSQRVIDADGRPVYFERSYVGGVPKLMLMWAWTKRLELHDLVNEVAKSCKRMKVDMLLIENKASGISVAQELQRLYGSEDWSVQLNNPGSQDKLARLYSVQHLFAEGMIFAPDTTWAEMAISQILMYPKGKHDDVVDTTSQGLRKLREMGLLVRAPERLSEIEERQRYTGRQAPPLYPG